MIEIGDTFKNPKFRDSRGRLRTFDRVVANPMWNQNWFSEADYDADELERFPAGAGFPGKSSADWGWVQHMHASLNASGRAAVVLDTGAASRGSGNAGSNKEKTVRQWFVDQDLIESVLYLPENLFYNTTAPGIVLFLNKAKSKPRRGRRTGCCGIYSKKLVSTWSKEAQVTEQQRGQIILYQTEDGESRIECRLIDETIWLSQAQIGELFGRSKKTVSEHLQNIFLEGELAESSVVRNFRTTAADGKTYEVAHYRRKPFSLSVSASNHPVVPSSGAGPTTN